MHSEITKDIMTIMYNVLNFLANNWLALLALIISIITLYFSHLQSFSPKIHNAGRYDLSINPHNSSQIAISPTLIFSNEGVRSGIIENLALIIKIPDSRKFLLMPYRVFTNTNINETKNALPFESEAFIRFQLTSKETISKQIMFIPPFVESFILPIGNYSIEIFAKTSKNKKFKKYSNMTIQIDSADLEEIKRNIPKLGQGERAYVEGVIFRSKITPELDEEYKSLLPYLDRK